jgi:23S rRNA pseudouridine1911/1915/1917 synthase
MIEFDPKQQILYEDNHIIIVNKLPSQIVQGDKTGDQPISDSIKDYLKQKYKKPGNVFLGVVHRLDRPVGGVVIFARTSKSLARLNKMIAEREIQKIYWAVVKEPPPKESDHLIHFITRNQKMNKSFASIKPGKESKKAELQYKHILSSKSFHLLEIMLLTGRHHQIRAQLAFIGCPIKGDLKYGFPRSNPNASIHLHARSICFLHPVKQEYLTFMAPPPNDPVWDYFVDQFE